VSFDLSAYAGKPVEVFLGYVTDPGTGGHGVLADDVSLVVGGAARETDGFEASLGAWHVAGPPAGSPAVRKDWARTGALFRTYAAVTTDDTVLLGFGLEQVPSAGPGGAAQEGIRRARGVRGATLTDPALLVPTGEREPSQQCANAPLAGTDQVSRPAHERVK
jgi:hypothetical protein